MKKVFGAFAFMVLLGGGCLGFGQKTVEGKWHLAFDLPSGWVMVKPYAIDTMHPLDTNVSRDDASVVLQSSDQKVCALEAAQCPEDSVKIGDGHIMVTATKLDSHRVLPENLESLGNDFYRQKLCDDGGDCQANGAGNYAYYLKVEGGSYSFTYFGEADTAERVIMSAEEVTKFTDATQIEVQSSATN